MKAGGIRHASALLPEVDIEALANDPGRDPSISTYGSPNPPVSSITFPAFPVGCGNSGGGSRNKEGLKMPTGWPVCHAVQQSSPFIVAGTGRHRFPRQSSPPEGDLPANEMFPVRRSSHEWGRACSAMCETTQDLKGVLS